MLANMKPYIKIYLERGGLFIRKSAGMPLGINLHIDLKRHGVPSPGFILDIGAHIGESSREFALHYPKAKIAAFEPVKANFERMKADLAEFDAIECVNQAVGNQCGVQQITLNSTNTQAHSLKWPPSKGERTQTVTVTTVDAFLKTREARPEFIKLDVEGYELQVLEGAYSTLKTGSVKSMLIEATMNPDDMSHTQLEAFRDFLSPFAFYLVGIYDQNAHGEPKQLTFFNAFFLYGGDVGSI